MGKRSTSRRLAVQALYQAEIAGIEIELAIANLLEDEQFIDETKQFATELATVTWQNRQTVDNIIKRLSIDWPLDRIGKVDRSILRLAIQEIRLKQTPDSVVINEAVELAKKYSSIEAAKFINGILGSFVRDPQD